MSKDIRSSYQAAKPRFGKDDRIRRNEAGPSVGGTVLEVTDGPDGVLYKIAYDEGGEGYWPEAALEAPAAR